MEKQRCVRQLLGWFGNREFRIQDIVEPDRVEILDELLGLPHRGNNIGTRSLLGRTLATMEGQPCHLENNRIYSLRIVRKASGSIPAIYQVVVDSS